MWCSHIKAIDDLYARKIPTGRPFKAEKIVRIGRNTFVARLPGNKWWTNVEGIYGVAMLPGGVCRPGDRHYEVLQGLVKLGFVSKEDLAAYEQRDKEIRERQTALADLADIERIMARYRELQIVGLEHLKRKVKRS
jgi:hypothetical protein